MNHRTATIFLAGALAAATAAWAAQPALPSLTLADPAGAAATEATLTQAGQWTLVIVDAERPITMQALSRLQKKEGDWGGKLVVIAAGTPAALERLIARHSKLTGARWYRDVSGQILKQMQLPGTPVMLGIRPDNSIAWQMTAIPEPPERTQAMVSGWIANSTVVR